MGGEKDVLLQYEKECFELDCAGGASGTGNSAGAAGTASGAGAGHAAQRSDAAGGLYLQRDRQGMRDCGGRAELPERVGRPPEAYEGRAPQGQRPGLYDGGGQR